MHSFVNTLRWVAMAAFMIAAGSTIYLLFQLPQHMSLQSSAINLDMMEEVSPVLQRLYGVIGITILSGWGAIVLSVSHRDKSGDQIAEFQVSEQQFSGAEEEKQQHSGDEFYIGDIETILSSTEDVQAIFNQALSQVCNVLEVSQGAIYRLTTGEEGNVLELFASYAYHLPEGNKITFRIGEGLVGQAAKDGNILNIDAVPEGYIQIFSGLGKASPKHLLVLPMKEGDKVAGMVELASFQRFQNHHVMALESYFGKLALKLSNSDNVSLEEAKS